MTLPAPKDRMITDAEAATLRKIAQRLNNAADEFSGTASSYFKGNDVYASEVLDELRSLRLMLEIAVTKLDPTDPGINPTILAAALKATA